MVVPFFDTAVATISKPGPPKNLGPVTGLPNRSEMMSLLVDSEKAITIDANAAFKSNWVTNSLDGTEDFLS